MIREKEVLDVWLDSGSMPYAQLHYPLKIEKNLKSHSQLTIFVKQ